MSRAAYWTIIAGGQPTAFRGRDREDLLPTLKQLQGKEPDARIVWFERGKVFETREDALADRRAPRERRPRDWRPGGEHRDPRAKYDMPRDEKRARFKQLAQKRRMRDEEGGGDRGARGRDREDRPFDPFAERPRRKFGDRPFGDRPKRDRPFGGGPKGGDDRGGQGGERPRRPWQNREGGERRGPGSDWSRDRRGPGPGSRGPGGPGGSRRPGGRGPGGFGGPPRGQGSGRGPVGSGRGPGSRGPGGRGPGGRGPGGRGPGGRGPGGGGRGPGGGGRGPGGGNRGRG